MDKIYIIIEQRIAMPKLKKKTCIHKHASNVVVERPFRPKKKIPNYQIGNRNKTELTEQL